MNEKEIRELRRRFRPDKTMISTVYGCYVNESGQIVSTMEEFLPDLYQEEAEHYLGLLKKSLSGTLGKNLIDISFSARQVMEGEEHKLLSLLRSTGLKDEQVRQTFYEQVIANLDLEGSYLILLTHDVYSVPYRTKDNRILPDASEEEFDYILCSVCPVKQTAPALGYRSEEERFRNAVRSWVVSPPELGFLFPAFDDRATNLYGALYYTRSVSENHQTFIDGIFRVEPPMPAAAQKETFDLILSQTLQEDCSLLLMQAFHQRLCSIMEAHKESKEPEQLLLTRQELATVLSDCGAAPERVEAFCAAFDASFGSDAQLPPANLIEKRRFVLRTADTTVQLDPETGSGIRTHVLNGSSYLLIPADAGLELNGVAVHIEK